MRQLLLLIVPFLFLSSCIEGPEIDENIYHRPPDGKVLYILYKTISPSEYRYNPADSLPYVDSIMEFYGPTRTIGLRYSPSGLDFDTVVLPTITKRDIGAKGCYEYNGAHVLLDEGEVYFVDYRSDGERLIEGELVRYEGQSCERLRMRY